VREELGRVSVEGADAAIVRDTDRHRIEVPISSQMAFITYRLDGDVLTLIHTEVPHAFREKGVAKALARAALNYARAQRLSVKPDCPFIARFIRRHPEYADLVA
jgi:predicted GNAT family acetyltransferase